MKAILLSLLVAITAVGSQHCPPGLAVTQCESDPCLDAQCPAVPSAVCKVSHCGGCSAHFYEDDDVKVDCDPFQPRIDNIHFRLQSNKGILEGDNMKMKVHHKEE